MTFAIPVQLSLPAQGVAPKVVTDLMGHSGIVVTMIYSHVVPALEREAAERMDAARQG